MFTNFKAAIIPKFSSIRRHHIEDLIISLHLTQEHLLKPDIMSSSDDLESDQEWQPSREDEEQLRGEERDDIRFGNDSEDDIDLICDDEGFSFVLPGEDYVYNN